MKKWPLASRIILITLGSSMSYAILRYHLLGPVPWKDFSMFILNKGTSLAAFILITLNFSLDPLKNLGMAIPQPWLDTRRALGMTGFLLVLIHALISFLLFKPSVSLALVSSPSAT